MAVLSLLKKIIKSGFWVVVIVISALIGICLWLIHRLFKEKRKLADAKSKHKRVTQTMELDKKEKLIVSLFKSNNNKWISVPEIMAKLNFKSKRQTYGLCKNLVNKKFLESKPGEKEGRDVSYFRLSNNVWKIQK